MTRPRIACLLALALATTPVAAADFQPVQGKEYREYFGQPIPVKGEAVVGVSIVGVSIRPTDTAKRSTALQVLVPAAYVGQPIVVSVEALSADGLFRGVGEYTGSVTEPGWTTLRLDPASKPSKRPTDPQALAVAVRQAASGEYLIARWDDGTAGAQDGIVRLYVNSRRADMSVLGRACTRIRGERLLRFDTLCDLPLNDIPPDAPLTLRRQDGFSSSYQDVVIRR